MAIFSRRSCWKEELPTAAHGSGLAGKWCITEGVHRSSWIRSQKTESLEGIPIRSELSNKDLILYPFLDLLYTERLPGSCNTRVSSEISWTQHVASFPHRLLSIPGDDICFVCPSIQYNPTFFDSQSSGNFGEFETRVQWRKPGASVTALLLRMPGRLCLFSSLLEASQFDRPCFFPGYREGFVVSSWPEGSCLESFRLSSLMRCPAWSQGCWPASASSGGLPLMTLWRQIIKTNRALH
jgi:hypothetical protein